MLDQENPMIFTYHASPLGELLVVREGRDPATGRPGGLTGLYLPTGRHVSARRDEWQRDDTAFDDVRTQLDEYFAGTRRAFDLPLSATGTDFQRRAWTALVEIPYGETRSYAKQAVAIGSPTAFRAVGLANGQNPISIIVPCHRVVGANGALTGYGGGLDAKRWLLAHEANHSGLFA
ncbi:methylated-DNA--[protein]-cysteine S-methyltransferase [Allocatelliglobosispora scoriae]|nr:methylated-DNA--[protein]-cysteine S-methyltransferase [Allocatelliglobosispora scoriae]